jgi:thiol peroxidase
MSFKNYLTGSLFPILFLASLPSQAVEPVKVSLHGKKLTIMGETLFVGQALPNISLPDKSLTSIKLNSFAGKVTILSVVPSIDTPTCEKQTHILSEENGGLDKSMSLVTISRDLPFAQKRFSKNAKIENI